ASLGEGWGKPEISSGIPTTTTRGGSGILPPCPLVGGHHLYHLTFPPLSKEQVEGLTPLHSHPRRRKKGDPKKSDTGNNADTPLPLILMHLLSEGAPIEISG
ncbi:unnamed protein product, partial [Discosporangium mesarthrocarpum]